MIEIISTIVVCLLLSCVIGFFIGYFVGRAGNNQNNSNYAINPVFTKQGNIYNKPFILGHPRPSGKDDLKNIEGIDEQIEHSLNAMGIFHFDQISKWTPNNCDWVEEYLDMKGHISQYAWIEQAKQLASKRL